MLYSLGQAVILLKFKGNVDRWVYVVVALVHVLVIAMMVRFWFMGALLGILAGAGIIAIVDIILFPMFRTNYVVLDDEGLTVHFAAAVHKVPYKLMRSVKTVRQPEGHPEYLNLATTGRVEVRAQKGSVLFAVEEPERLIEEVNKHLC